MAARRPPEDDLQRLTAILRDVGPERIWRPVHAPGNRLLAEGIGCRADGLADDGRLDFRGKTVADLGCNFGYYTFKVRKAGAAHVTGIDIDRRVVLGCRILQRLHGAGGVSFLVADITKASGLGTFDTGMMIDLIGKGSVARGTLVRLLDALERVSEKEMILSVRPAYRIRKHLDGDFQGLAEKYPEPYIGRTFFHTIAYVRDRFRRNWRMEILSPDVPEGAAKATLRFVRR